MCLQDFVSIFAANNLVSDDLVPDDLDDERYYNQDKLNLTLPRNFYRKHIKAVAERPRTLTPPCTQTNKKQRFRKRDWKFYVHGKYKTLIPVQKKQEYGFMPIKNSDDQSQINDKGISDDLRKTYSTEVLFLNPTGTKTINGKNDNLEYRKNVKNHTSELQLNVCDNVIVSSSTSSSEGSEQQLQQQSQLQNVILSDPTSDDKLQTCPTKNSVLSVRSLEIDLTADNNKNTNVLKNSIGVEIVVNQNQLPVYSSYAPAKGDASKGICGNANVKDKSLAVGAFQPVKRNNNNNSQGKEVQMDKLSQRIAILKSPVLRRPVVPVLCNTQPVVTVHEGMTSQLSTESSTSDTYYRESSLSPSSPDYKAKPVITLPPPPALEKHEVRLKSSGRSSSATRSKSADRKNKKRSKSKDSKSNSKRDPSPSKTERSKEGKISTATQTKKSTKSHKTDNKTDHTNVVKYDSFESAVNTYSVSNLPMPVSKRAAMESSTSSDESGDYKKVNIIALRERFMQNREKSKHIHKNNNNKGPKAKKIESKNHSKGSKETNTSSASQKINGAFSGDTRLRADNTAFTPMDKTERFDNDILENDMYNFEDSRDSTPVNGFVSENQSIPYQGCSHCSEISHFENRQCSESLQIDNLHCCDEVRECQQLNQIECLNETANSNSALLQEEQRNIHTNQINEFVKQNQDAIVNFPSSQHIPLCTACINKYKEGNAEDGNSNFVIPPRDERRMMTVHPPMPVIVEDLHKSSCDSDTETLGSNAMLDATGIVTVPSQTVKKQSDSSNVNRKQPKMSVQSKSVGNKNMLNITVPANSNVIGPGPKSPKSPGIMSVSSLQSQSSVNSITSQSSDVDSQQSVSLLDRLHKKYYPGQYNKRTNSEDSVSSTLYSQQQSNNSSSSLEAQETMTSQLSGDKTSSNTKQQQEALCVVVPVSSSSSSSSRNVLLSPRLRKSEEGKPPPSPTSLTRSGEQAKSDREQKVRI